MKILAVAALAASIALPAVAQQGCGPRDNVLDVLASRYGEARAAIMLDSDNNVVEVFVSPATGTWTVLRTAPGGVTCIVTYGNGYESTADALPPAGDHL